MPDLIDVDSASRRLGVCSKTLRRLAAQGQVPLVRVGRAVRFDPADLDEFVSSAKQPITPRTARRTTAKADATDGPRK